MTDNTIKSVEEFICKICGTTDSFTDCARVKLFKKAQQLEVIPPTSDALALHIKRAHLQASVWLQADICHPDLPLPENMGWNATDKGYMPILMTLPPIPDTCFQLVSCGCKGKCESLRCKCRKSKVPCAGTCYCGGECFNS